MSKFLEILEECCKDGGECKCKKGEKCDSPSCKCKGKKKVVKESTLTEAKVCPQCGIKYSKISKDEGFCTECATPIKESYDDEAGDAKFHAKKDDDACNKDDKGCANCGSKKGFVAGKCLACGKPSTKLKESKFDQYLQEAEQLDENIEIGNLDNYKDLQAMVVGKLKKGLPKSIPSSMLDGLINDFKKLGLDDEAEKLVKAKGSSKSTDTFKR